MIPPIQIDHMNQNPMCGLPSDGFWGIDKNKGTKSLLEL
jgi:hypothetical protein